MVVAYHVGVELVGDPDLVPIGRGVAVLYQTLDLFGMKMTPAVGWFLDLLVTIVILIMSIVEVLLVDEIFVNPVVR
jgi:hypothetical protein